MKGIKYMKRLLTLILTFCIMINLFVLPISVSANTLSFAGENYETYYYSITNGEVTIERIHTKNDAFTGATRVLNIPEKIDGYPVTKIIATEESNANAANIITKICLPKTISSIRGTAFESLTALQEIIYNGTKTQWQMINITNFFESESYPIGYLDTYYVPWADFEAWKSSISDVTITFNNTNNDSEAKNTCGINLTWVLENGVLTINGTGAMTNWNNATSDNPPWYDLRNNIKSIVINEGASTIGDNAFADCSNLENISIPNSIVSIGTLAFWKCTKLEHVDLYNNITNIGSWAFQDCDSLTEVTIPNALTVISKSTFVNCDNLTKITISKNVDEIKDFAFDGCTNLTDIYYGGSAQDWKDIIFGSYDNYFSNATIHYADADGDNLPPIEPPASEYKEPSYSSGEFNFASGSTKKAEFFYSDSFFDQSSYIYDHSLAKMSIRFALSAFAKKSKNNEHIDYSKQYINAYNLLDECDFKNIDWNTDYEEQPWVNGIGVIAGSKKIAYGNGDYTLIAVALRGGGYEAEWGGNFNVGDSEYHEGFKTASSFAVQFIQDYIEEYEIKGNVKLWITGFSRAAATTNLTAAYFDEHPEWLHDDVTLTRDNLYAYCFETPAGVVEPDNENEIFDNIFSIVNQHDPVPMVAMRKWGFDRYGITKYLPAAQTNNNYNELRDKMIPLYKKYRGGDASYTIDEFSKYSYASTITGINDLYNGQGVYLEKTIDKLANSIGSTINYKNNYQDAFVYIGEELIGYKNTNDFVDRLLLELSTRAAIKESFYLTGDVLISDRYIIKKSLESTFEYTGISINEETIDVLLDLIIDLGFDDFITILKNIGNFGQAHHPELCMAWMDAIDESDFSNDRLRTLYLNCPVDVEIYDSNDALVAAIYNNVPQKITGSTVIAYLDENEQKIIHLPTDEEYRIEVTVTDDGEVTYSVQEYNANTKETRVINYNNMNVSTNDTMTGTVENLTLVENATYALASNTATISEAEIIENAQQLSLTVNCDGNGNVLGGGHFYKGEFAKVVATPFAGEEFLGWYNGDVLISSDLEYRFSVESDIILTAKFTNQTCEVIYIDNDSVINIERINKGMTVSLPEAPSKTGYIFSGYYADINYTNLIDESTIFEDDTFVYLKYTKKSSGGGGTSSYTIKFETNGGNKVSNKSVRRNNTLTEPTVPTKDGFTFEGWYTDKELTKAYDFSTKVTKGFTLYAKWEDIKKSQIILTIGDKEALVFGETKENDVAPKIVNDRTMLPIRFIAEALGAEVIWTETEPNKILIKKENIEIIINIGSDTTLVNGKKVELDSPTFIENDRTYLPLRFISENLGAKVEWVEDNQQVIITK